MGILRLAHIDVRTPDLDLATAYYTDVMGLQQVQRDAEHVWFKCWDEEDHHSLRMRYDPRTGLDSFTFRVEREDDLHDFEKKLADYGCQVSRVSRGEAVGQGESIRFEVPSGQIMELVWDIEKTGNILGKRNPSPVPPPDLPGIAPPRMDHMLVNAEEVGESARFFQEVLGLRLTEQVLDGNGHQLGVWLAGRTNSPHDIAIVNGPNGALHHWAYWLDDWDHIRKAADTLAYNGVQIDQGPTRHGVTRGNTIYFFDPLGIRNEVFTGGYWVDPDTEIITWTENEFGKGLFYYENVVAQRFLRMHTVSDRILRLQHVEIRVPDLELCTAYYTEVLGLIETARTDNQVFLKCWDEREHHSVILRQAPTYGLDHMAFKVAEAADLDYFTEKLQAASVPVKRYAARELGPGWGESIRFDAPSGHLVELTHGTERVGNMLPMTNPPPRPQDLVGIAPPRLDHVFVMAEDVEAFTRFFTELLEFRLTEQIVANDGHQLATFLERSHTPHDIAVITGPNGALHHFAFWLDDWNGIRDAADTLAYHGVDIDVAPTRHGVTRGYTTYFFDPVGNRNELFTGGYWVDPDFEPITWTEEEMGRAIFYYHREVNERFFTVHS